MVIWSNIKYEAKHVANAIYNNAPPNLFFIHSLIFDVVVRYSMLTSNIELKVGYTPNGRSPRKDWFSSLCVMI